MRSFFAVLAVSMPLAALAAPAARAECAGYAEQLLTPEVVGERPLIVMQVHRYADRPADQAPPFELVTAQGRKLALTTRAQHEGFAQVQLELVPAQPLTPGTYTVRRVTPPPWGERERHSLKVAARPARPEVLPPAQLEHRGSTFVAYGCGPGEHLELGLSPDEAALVPLPGLWFVTLSDARGRHATGFVQRTVEDRTHVLAVGHGMCSGEFSLDNDMDYTVAVQPIGSDGTFGPTRTIAARYHPEE